jgi:hypothetical protein
MRKLENPFTFYDKEKIPNENLQNRQIAKVKLPELSSLFHGLAEARSNI